MYPKKNIPVSQVIADVRAVVFDFQQDHKELFKINHLQHDQNFLPIESFEVPENLKGSELDSIDFVTNTLEGRELNFLDVSTMDSWSLGLELSRGVFRNLCDELNFNKKDVAVRLNDGKTECEKLILLSAAHGQPLRAKFGLTQLESGFFFLSDDGDCIDLSFWDNVVAQYLDEHPMDGFNKLVEIAKSIRPHEGCGVSIKRMDMPVVSEFTRNALTQLLGGGGDNPPMKPNAIKAGKPIVTAHVEAVKQGVIEAELSLPSMAPKEQPSGFQPDAYYRPQDTEMRQIAKVQTLASWRYQEKGPHFSKSGGNVVYKGSDILKWLDNTKVFTK